MSEGYYSWKSRRAKLVRECEELGLPTDGSNNRLAAEIHHAKNPPVAIPVAPAPDERLALIRRRDRAAAGRLVARSSRGRWADEGGYSTPAEAFNDLYGEVA